MTTALPTEASAPAAPDPGGTAASDDTLFPAGTAVLALTLGFFATRVFIGLSGEQNLLARGGTFAAVAGALLGLVAVGRLAWEATARHGRWGALAGRAFALAPVLVLSLVSMRSVHVSHGLQWAALCGLAATIITAGVRALVLAATRGRWLAALTLSLFVVGQLIELVAPVASFASAPGAALPRLALALGNASELCAFLGITASIAWAIRAAVAHVGVARAGAFVVMPAGFTAVLLSLPARLPRTTESVARGAFGARFDLAGVGGAGHPSRGALMVYTLLFAGLITASSVSLATQGNDRGGGVRRALGWTCVLLAGFGAVSIAGPLDPLRAVLVALGVLLLEQAVERVAVGHPPATPPREAAL